MKYTIGLYGSHNASVAIARDDTILEVIEVERFVSKKNMGLWYYYHLDPPLNTECLKEIRDYLYDKYRVEKYHAVVYNSVYGDCYKTFLADEYIWYAHHEAHASGGFYQSPYEKAIILSYDGGSDEGFFNVYIGDKTKKTLEKIYAGERDYAVPYMMPAHYIEDIRQEELFWGNLVYAGKIMGLAAYGSSTDPELYSKFLQFYNSGDCGSITETHSTFNKIFGEKRLTGQEAKDMAAMNQRVFEELMLAEIKPMLDKYPELPIVVVGGCGLNILANTRLKAETGRQVFVPPNPNDCGLGVGVLARHLKPSKPIDCTYIGPEVWDRRELLSHVVWRKGRKTNPKEVVDMISRGMIFGVVRDRCEHGPRALGNRSIICSATRQDMKDVLNAKVKNREYYRPFAPLVRLEDVSKFFEWEGESRWMAFCPRVRSEWREYLPPITHADGTARVQTVTREQNPFIYDLLTEMHSREFIPILINTSFNVAGKPILNTYREALQVLDTTKLDAVILEDYLITKQ
jgi:carbamoyltransferase